MSSADVPQSDDLPTIHVYGPNVTKETVAEVGQAYVDLFDAVAESKGMPKGLVRLKDVMIACDSCDARRPWDDEGHGWVRTADGHDYCSDCIIAEPRAAS